ncbi:putative transmembrane protein [Gregarina niphandrodes]|uniref:Transmembrane protein n=1 Tax=Gregarina niphandrodes TaxID=110365 RepID=A0A023B6R9_GRENI|nr:putative transmembrane protein [Gregarina niphandrodes]EZG66755.1 putative transmembrane protein [Gregarina niphandrodes]|eukprot:XP_011130498.1 putative transmembrane protein [Gregarina niphandrodes]
MEVAVTPGPILHDSSQEDETTETPTVKLFRISISKEPTHVMNLVAMTHLVVMTLIAVTGVIATTVIGMMTMDMTDMMTTDMVVVIADNSRALSYPTSHVAGSNRPLLSRACVHGCVPGRSVAVLTVRYIATSAEAFRVPVAVPRFESLVAHRLGTQRPAVRRPAVRRSVQQHGTASRSGITEQ